MAVTDGVCPGLAIVSFSVLTIYRCHHRRLDEHDGTPDELAHLMMELLILLIG